MCQTDMTWGGDRQCQKKRPFNLKKHSRTPQCKIVLKVPNHCPAMYIDVIKTFDWYKYKIVGVKTFN